MKAAELMVWVAANHSNIQLSEREPNGGGVVSAAGRRATCELIWNGSETMKISHLANLLLMIVGGAAQEVAHAVKRRWHRDERE